jgi:hypothetical protein
MAKWLVGSKEKNKKGIKYVYDIMYNLCIQYS